MHALNVQMLKYLVPCNGLDRSLSKLSQLALVEIDASAELPQYRRSVRAADQVIALAQGDIVLDRALEHVAELATPTAAGSGPPCPELERALSNNVDGLIILAGAEGSGRIARIRSAAATCGSPLLVIRANVLAKHPGSLQRNLSLIARECRLHEAIPVFCDIDSLDAHVDTFDESFLRKYAGVSLATARDALTWRISRPVLPIVVEGVEGSAREALWRTVLPDAADSVVRECAVRYNVTPGTARRCAVAAIATVANGSEVTSGHIQVAIRNMFDQRLRLLARRTETKQTWADLVLPADQNDLLLELISRVRHRRDVLDDWGFADKVGRGLGLTTMLSGPPGTGKTMIAGLVARELGLDLYQVDLSKIMSKYIGETEKQLGELLDAAEAGHAVLLFDEADSLFAKRTEVKSSNDRYANLEVNYLLQRLEAFSGIAILTTNHETAIDKAFMRRLAFNVRVPVPESRERELLWKNMIPARAACDTDLDLAALADRFEMTGGYIKNAVVRAAFFAAAERRPIGNRDLWRAAHAEYEAMGKIAYVDRG
jgi:AAA+ superfamily predicted ATPase